MGVIFTHDVGDWTRRLHIFAVPDIAALMAGIENAAVDGFQAVAHIGQRTADNHAHGVVEIGTLHLLDDGDGIDAFRPSWRRLVGQWTARNLLESPASYIGSEAGGTNLGCRFPEVNIFMKSVPYELLANDRKRPARSCRRMGESVPFFVRIGPSAAPLGRPCRDMLGFSPPMENREAGGHECRAMTRCSTRW